MSTHHTPQPAYESSPVGVDDGGKDWARTEEVRHSKEDAITARQFERLVESTYRMDDDYFALECRLVLYLSGRLGMRGGEIAHMTEEWIDWDNQIITIPSHEKCTDGRDGGICGHCRGAAKQMAATRSENALQEHYRELAKQSNPILEPGGQAVECLVDPERFEAQMWSTKSHAGARDIPYEKTSTRAALAIEDYFNRFNEFKASRGIVNRRVAKMAEKVGCVNADELYPHALRATAASHIVDSGLGAMHLKQLMGWSEFSTALNYLEESTARLEAALDQLHK